MYTKYSIEDIKEKLRECLTEERYLHSVGTMEMAAELAGRFNCDEGKAQVAGLLHDCAKCLSDKELEKYADTFEECEKINPKTWHAPAGAVIAKRSWGITDEEILSAIRLHTIGRKGMSDFEKIIFIADKIEHRTRDEKFREKIEKTLNKTNNLDAALLKSFKLTIRSLLKRRLPICFQTVDVYNELINSVQNN